MSAIENLPPDQRAVLQMVLQRGRSYDEIASLLSIERNAVRQRALDACDALTPATVLPGPERALVSDYLLAQLPERVAEQVYAYLQASDSDREWAHALAGVLEPLASGALPEIPVGAPLGADAGASGGLEAGSDSPAADTTAPVAAWEVREPSQPRQLRQPREPREPRRSSRRGGAILLSSVGAVIVAAIVVAIVTSGGGKQAPHRSKPSAATGPAQSGSPTTAAGTTSATGTASAGSTSTSSASGTSTTAAPQILAQLNLTSPTHAAKTVGIVQVERVDGILGIVIDAQGVPANTSHNAYAVWLYNSPTSHKRVGFVPNLVGKNGELITDGRLPAGAAAYHRILITLETQSNPTSPGEVVLSAPFREHP